MKNFNQKNKRILSFITIVFTLFFSITSLSLAVTCYNSSGFPIVYYGDVCPSGKSYTDPTLPPPTSLPSNCRASADGSFISCDGTDITDSASSQGTSLDLSGGTSKTSTSTSVGGKFVPSDKGSGFIPSDKAITETGFTALAGMINTIIKWFVGMSATIAAISFSYAGAQMLLHPEEESKLSEAKEMFVKTFWGILIVIGAWLIINTIITTLVSNPKEALRFLSN